MNGSMQELLGAAGDAACRQTCVARCEEERARNEALQGKPGDREARVGGPEDRGEPGQEQWGPVERQELPGRGWSDSGVLNYAPVGSQESLSWEEAGRKREGED